MEDWPSAAPMIGAATGSTKVGEKEWRSGRIHRGAHLGRRRAARWPAADLNGGRRRLHTTVVLRCISGDGERRNRFISARGCLRRPRFAPVGLQAGESGRRTRPPAAAPCADDAGRRWDAARRGEARRGARRPLTARFIGDAAQESWAGVHAQVGWPTAACPPWTPPADGLWRASDGPRAGRRLGDGLGRAHDSAQSGRIDFFKFSEIHL
jgi:hypothetical protein